MLLRDPISGDKAQSTLLEKAKSEPGVLGRVRGIISQCDTENKNGRIYERSLWEDLLKSDEFKKNLSDRRFLGELDHPETRTESSIKEAAHALVDAQLDEKGNVIGEFAIFDVPAGRVAHQLMKAGVKLGFSTRGDGDLVEDEKTGKMKVERKSFKFHGVDYVLNPSFAIAAPGSLGEDVKKGIRTALTESVQTGKVDKGVVEQVESLIEPKKPEEKPTPEVKKPPSESISPALVTLEGALREAHFRVRELEEQILSLESDKRAALAEKMDALKAIEEARKIGKGSKREQESISEIKELMKEQEGKHLAVVERNKILRQKIEVAEKVVDSLKTKIDGLTVRLKKVSEESMKKDGELKSLPSKLAVERLSSYKRVKSEGLELSEQQQKLLEHAQTEVEVDEFVESLRTSRALKNAGLPNLLNSREERKRVVEAVGKQVLTEGAPQRDKKTEEQEKDGRDVAKALASQL